MGRGRRPRRRWRSDLAGGAGALGHRRRPHPGARGRRRVHHLHAGLHRRRRAQRRRQPAPAARRHRRRDDRRRGRGLRVRAARAGRHRGRPAVEPGAHPARQPRPAAPGPTGRTSTWPASSARCRRHRSASSACSSSTTFFPPADRTKLALRLNGLLASPAFAAWGQGDPLDIDAMLRARRQPACAIVSLAHLSDEERQFVVTLVLSKLVTWMRRQPGTDQLRALVYFDEVMGFVPPTAAPPGEGADPHDLQAGPGVRRRPGAGHAEPGRRRLQGAVQRRHVDDRPAPDRAGQGPAARRPVGGGRRRRRRGDERHHRRAGQAGVRAAPGRQRRRRAPSPAAGRCPTSGARSPASRSPP